MTQEPIRLPPEFADLNAFAEVWAAPASDARHHQRQIRSLAEIRAFYEAMLPRLDAIFRYLDPLDLATLPVPERQLLYLTFGFGEAALSIELFNAPGVTDSPYPHGFHVVRELREFKNG
jgi:hypothetical protein